VFIAARRIPGRAAISVRPRPRARLGQPSGSFEVSISHSSELRVGDVVWVERASGLAAFSFGDAFGLSVHWVDPSGAKFGLELPNGDQEYVDAGSRAELVAKLRDKVGSDASISVWRREAGAAPGDPIQAARRDLVSAALAMGLPADHGPFDARTMGDLRAFDWFLSISPWSGDRRLWWVSNAGGDRLRLTLAASSTSADVIGEEVSVPATDVVDTARQLSFRAGLPLYTPSAGPGGAEESDLAMLVGIGAVAAGLAFAFLGR